MHAIIKGMLGAYSCTSVEDYENALKEIIQHIALLGMWRAKFFEVGAFYGGTALRILYGLDRFSEDLDFSLLKAMPGFDIATYEAALTRELNAFGFEVKVEKKVKRSLSSVESAFIKANTMVHLIQIRADLKTHKDRLLQVKLEVDTDPPGGETTEVVRLFSPVPYSVLTFTQPVLLAGKLTAALFRTRTVNVKGRDWYDFLWYIGRQVPCDLAHLTARLRQIGQWPHLEEVRIDDVRHLLHAKIDALDLAQAQADVRPFVRDAFIVDQWSKDLFHDAASRLQGV